MKVYNLACQLSHHFEGWFRSEEDFFAQQKKSMLSCPICESSDVTRMPSAPYLGSKKSNSTELVVEKDSQKPSSNGTGAPSKDAMQLSTEQKHEFHEKMQAKMLSVVREMMTNSEDVGESFAEEARKIHYQESPPRSIRGVTTVDEAAELIDEGIEVFSLPISPILKSTLQ
jgi:hypothetical protein